MGKSDKETLIEMGFSEAKVRKALKETKNAGLQPAMDWLLAHVDDPDPVMGEEEDTPSVAEGNSSSAGPENDGEITADQATAQSLRCDDCGKLLRDANAAQFHAVKTQHANFSESTEAIKPLTAEEKAQKLAELQAKLAARREEKRLAELQEQREREKVRRKTGKEVVDLKEKMEQQEMAKALALKKKEKEEERLAKERIRAQLEADKRERQRQAEERKRLASGQAATAPEVIKPVSQSAVSNKNYDESRLQIRMPSGAPLTNTFSASDKLSVVFDYVTSQSGGSFKLFQTFPRKELTDKSKTLKELNLVPSAALMAQPM